MSSRLKYWFYHNDSVGNIYESDKFGLVIVFDGTIKFGEPFHIKNYMGDLVTGDEKREIIEAITGAVAESVQDEQ